MTDLTEPIPENDSTDSEDQQNIKVLGLRREVFQGDKKQLNALISFFLILLCLFLLFSHFHFCIEILNEFGDGLLIGCQLGIIITKLVEIESVKDMEHG